MVFVLIKSLVPPAGEAGKNFAFNRIQVEKWAEAALKKHNLENCELSIVFVGPKKIRSLNKNYRKIDKSTSVLTFFQGQAECPERSRGIPEEILMLGDIVICPIEAEKKNLSVKFLLEHGIRNLLSEIPTAKNLRD